MNGNNEIKSSSHSKYRRKEIYGKIKKDIGEILRKLCIQKGVEIFGVEDIM